MALQGRGGVMRISEQGLCDIESSAADCAQYGDDPPRPRKIGEFSFVAASMALVAEVRRLRGLLCVAYDLVGARAAGIYSTMEDERQVLAEVAAIRAERK